MEQPDWVPDLLYKYFSSEGLKRFLSNGMVRFTQPSQFNDPFEFFPAFHRGSLKKIIRRHLLEERQSSLAAYNREEFEAGMSNALQNEEVFATVSLELFERYLADWDKVMGVFCLSSDPTNILMWSHYADEFRGGAIQFNTRHKFFYGKEGLNLAKVGYRKKRPVVVVDDKQYKTKPEMLAWKAPEWAYEKEYRMFELLDNMKAASHNPNVYLYQLPQDAVSGMVLGPRMSEDMKAEIQQLSTAWFKDINFYQASLNPFEFKVDIRD